MPRKRTSQGERKIEGHTKGRVYWKSGEEHPLDVLFEELDQLRSQIPNQLATLLTSAQTTEQRLHAIQEAMQDTSDPTSLFAATNEEAHRTILDRFPKRKHSTHLLTILTIQRYKRLIGRMNAIQAALDLANGLLEEEEAFSPERLAVWRNLTSKEESETTPLPDVGGQEKPLESGEESAPTLDVALETQEEPPDKAKLRLQGIDEPLTPVVGSVEQSRRLLREFEQRLPELRRQLSTGQGWFEVFFVPKYRFKAEVVTYMKALIAWREHKIPFIPEEIEQSVHPEVRRLVTVGAAIPKHLRDEAYICIRVGPYVKYRWTEQKRTYSVSLGLDDDYPPYPFTPAGFSS